MAYLGVQPTAGQYRKLDDISGSFNGSTTTFTTQVGGQNVTAGSAQSILVSLGGVIQSPGTNYSVSTNSITFVTAPAAGLSFFAILLGEAVNTGTPSDGTVTPAKLSTGGPSWNSTGNVVLQTAGTTAAPALQTTGDTNTGIYFPAADTIGFVEGGVEVMRIDSSGRVGIGATTVDEKLHVEGSSGQNTTIKVESTATSAERSAVEFFTGSVSRGRVSGSNDFDGLTLDSSTTESAAVIRFRTGGGSLTEKARLDSSGRLLVGTSSAVAAAVELLQIAGVAGNTASPGGIALTRASVNNTDDIGFINFSNRSAGAAHAQIKAICDGTPGTNDYPGALVFSTTADGASSPTERMRIRADGSIEMGKADSGDKLAVLNAASQGVISAYATNASYAATATYVNVSRAANTAYSFIKLISGDFADTEFHLRGDGNAFADGTWSGGGADYAEYFEWSDGNPDEEDRRGISVVLDGNQIRPAVDGEDPIGVISGNPSVVGDAAWNKWSGKYLRDDYGTYILEDYEVVNDEGETVIQQRRKLNPAYDPDQEYVNREDRPEWDCVGLMGKLRIRKGQPTGSRWIKMRDISDSVEEWLVR